MRTGVNELRRERRRQLRLRRHRAGTVDRVAVAPTGSACCHYELLGPHLSQIKAFEAGTAVPA